MVIPCRISQQSIQHDPTIHVPEACRTAAGTNVHPEPVLSACRPAAEAAEAAEAANAAGVFFEKHGTWDV